MHIDDFVKARFGQKQLTLLKNMGAGGISNKKGSDYEIHFTMAKVFEIAACHQELDDFLISRQEYGYVDDIVIRQESSKTKHNYQAKNSKGAPSKWDPSIEKKFRMQHEIDVSFHGYQNSYQTLLVSDNERAIKNTFSIPDDMKGYSTSEYYPSAQNLFELLRVSSSLRNHASKVCNSSDLSDLDAAIRIVLSVCHDACQGASVGDIIGRARATSKPDLFAGTIGPRSGPPGWLLQKCSQYPGMTAELKLGSIVVSYFGFEVTLGANVGVDVAEEHDCPIEFMHNLMKTLTPQLV